MKNNTKLLGMVRKIAARGTVNTTRVNEAWTAYQIARTAQKFAAEKWEIFEQLFRALDGEDMCAVVALRTMQLAGK